MKVTLIQQPANALRILYTAARGCYSPADTADIFASDVTDEKMRGLIDGIIARNHNSVLRHVQWTWAIDGISRACANQLTRHGPGWAFDQQSLRYVRLSQAPEWVIPGHLTEEQKQIMRDACNRTFFEYSKYIAVGWLSAEDARGVLPLATPTNVTATANLAAFMHFYRVRVLHETGRAQDEIAELGRIMADQLIAAEPWLAESWAKHVGG